MKRAEEMAMEYLSRRGIRTGETLAALLRAYGEQGREEAVQIARSYRDGHISTCENIGAAIRQMELP